MLAFNGGVVYGFGAWLKFAHALTFAHTLKPSPSVNPVSAPVPYSNVWENKFGHKSELKVIQESIQSIF